MRISTLLITGLLLACSTQAIAQTRLDCLDEVLLKVKNTGGRGIDIVEESSACMRYHPKPSSSSAINDDTSYYDFKVWEARQDMYREIEAINRDYNLRRSGVIP